MDLDMFKLLLDIEDDLNEGEELEEVQTMSDLEQWIRYE